MGGRFSEKNWTTFALLALLALTLVAFFAVPTRRVAAHRPPPSSPAQRATVFSPPEPSVR